MHLLLVEDQEDTADSLIRALKEIDQQYQITHVTTVTEAISRLNDATAAFDIALVDLGLPDAEGDQAPASLCRLYPELAVVIYTGETSSRLASDIMRMGAQDFIRKGEFRPDAIDRVLRFAVQRNQRINSLKQEANTDPLTGLLNRRGFNAALNVKLAESGSGAEPHLALFSIDLDGFKGVNDTHGHPTGDSLLQQCAHRIEGAVRVTDNVARGGGDEFFLLCEALESEEEITRIADKLLEVIAAPYSINKVSIQISASIGIARLSHHKQSLEALYSASDAALYEAKSRGKNHAVLYREDESLSSVAAPPGIMKYTAFKKPAESSHQQTLSLNKKIHKMRNDLNIVSLEADLIKLIAEGNQIPQIGQAVERIQKQCSALSELISEFGEVRQ